MSGACHFKARTTVQQLEIYGALLHENCTALVQRMSTPRTKKQGSFQCGGNICVITTASCAVVRSFE